MSNLNFPPNTDLCATGMEDKAPLDHRAKRLNLPKWGGFNSRWTKEDQARLDELGGNLKANPFVPLCDCAEMRAAGRREGGCGNCLSED